MLVPCILGWGLFYPWKEFPQYLTNWGMILVLTSLCLSSYLPYDQEYRKKPCLMALNHIIFSLSLILEMIIMLVYWTLLWKGIYARNKGNMGILVYQVACHTVPALAL